MRPGDDLAFTSAGTGHDSPLIFDSDMGDTLQESDLEFFNAALPQDSPPSHSDVLDGQIRVQAPTPALPSARQAPDYSSPAKVAYTQAQQTLHPLGRSSHSRPISNPSSASPPSPTLDSSSDSSRGHKRKTSSNSSHSGLARADVMMTDDVDMSEWKVDDLMTGGDGPTFGAFGGSFLAGTPDPLGVDPDFESSNKAMENHFDFESAASSPSPVGAGATSQSSSARLGNTFDMPYRDSPRMQRTYNRPSHISSRSTGQASMTGFSAQTSREPSPLPALIASQESSPTNFFKPNTPSPIAGSGFGSGPMLSSSSVNPVWPNSGLPALSDSSMTSPYQTDDASPQMLERPALGEGVKPALTIHPTPLKSRVETQIPIKMTLHPVPEGVTKLNLPTHTISKPKLLAKPKPESSPDTLELHTMLVCTSAMQSPEKLNRAFAHAAGDEATKKNGKGRRPSSGDTAADEDEDDENNPLNGGQVDICLGCITRERKRAARKKVKKVEEEDSWHQDEHKRIIVFNTHEIKEWQPPSKGDAADEISGRAAPYVPEGAMQVDAPMRIACYCRHQNEKLGFQVIFTIKDHLGNLVAQAITSSIMITDDHKTHAPPPPLNAASSVPDGSQLPGAGMFPSGPGYGLPAASPIGMAPFRLSHSSSDLQSLQHSYSSPYAQTPRARSQNVSQAVSVSQTPRNLSRQASPTGASGHSNKKRKSSGASKVPSGLAMTRLETSQAQQMPHMSTAPTSGAIASSSTSPFTPGYPPFMPAAAEQPHLPAQQSLTPHFPTGPSTPNGLEQGFLTGNNRSHSMENLPVAQMFSAPTSTHQSRAPSPIGASRNSANAFQQAQMAQAVANGIYGLPLALNPLRPPTIHKLIPNEGPKSGGIEVTCLGSGFCQGLEVMFGDALATTTTYWGETSLVCLLPPAVQAGTVAVMFKHDQQQQQLQPYPSPSMPKQQAWFKYTDDDEQQLLRMALSVLGHKMTGRMEDVRDIARRIVGSGSNSWGPSAANSPTGGTQNRHAPGLDPTVFGMFDVEATLLKCLDLIDLDDSAYQPRLNLRRSSGQTMLHLACSLGLHRFVAALLARGANPDPRDRGGFSPMHFAALHNHPQIVRRLILNGADPTMRSLQGYTPADLATSEEVLRSTRRIEHHSRTRSGPSSPSNRRATSVACLRSLWAPARTVRHQSGPVRGLQEFHDSDGTQSEDEDKDEVADDDRVWSRRNSKGTIAPDAVEPPNVSQLQRRDDPTVAGGAISMAAWRDQLATQLQHLHQTVQGNLPNLRQIPTFPPMPNLPDYQTYLPNPMARRISSLVPQRGPSRPSTSGDGDAATKEGDYRWWELFSSAAPPPAYDDIYPQMDEREMNLKKSSAIQAAADTIADQRYAELYPPQSSLEGSNMHLTSYNSLDVRVGGKPMSKDEQARLRTAHAKKMKKIKSDRNLFFIWIPLLIIIVLAMLKNRVPEVWNGASQMYAHWRHQQGERVQEVL